MNIGSKVDDLRAEDPGSEVRNAVPVKEAWVEGHQGGIGWRIVGWRRVVHLDILLDLHGIVVQDMSSSIPGEGDPEVARSRKEVGLGEVQIQEGVQEGVRIPGVVRPVVVHKPEHIQVGILCWQLGTRVRLNCYSTFYEVER